MQTADQARVVGVKADRHHIDLEVLGLENDGGARNRKLADPALTKAATDHDAFGIGPGLALEKSLRHIGQLLREFLDRAVHQGCGADVVADQRLVKGALADRLGGLAAERILAAFLQRLAERAAKLSRAALFAAGAPKTPLGPP